MKGVGPLIKDTSFGALLADKAFDANWLLGELNDRGAQAVIPPKSNRKIQRPYDEEVYKWRHLIEKEVVLDFRPVCSLVKMDQVFI